MAMTVVVVVSWSGLKTAMLLADHLKCEIHGRFSECDLIVDDFKAHLNDPVSYKHLTLPTNREV